MTAGSGLQHSEMFPLLNKDDANTLHLFQIWLNLPKAKKFAEPHYKMLWAEDIPNLKINDKQGKNVEITVIAGKFEDTSAPEPAPDSWASNPENELAIWIIKMEAGAQWTLPPASQPVNRILYFHEGSSIRVAGSNVSSNKSIEILADEKVLLENGEGEAHFLLLQGRPIGEPVVQYGPFVMNTQSEIHQAFDDYKETQFGGWPWDRNDPVHSDSKVRFAKFSDGTEESKGIFPD
jgi:redox-sensitive bicupin YhaK (pirin superfamily)